MKNFKIIELMELFDEGEVIPASEMQRPQQALDREMFQDANKRLNFYKAGLVEKGPNKGKYSVKFPTNTALDEKYKGTKYGTKTELENLIKERAEVAKESYRSGVARSAQKNKQTLINNLKSAISQADKTKNYNLLKLARRDTGGILSDRTAQFLNQADPSSEFYKGKEFANKFAKDLGITTKKLNFLLNERTASIRETKKVASQTAALKRVDPLKIKMINLINEGVNDTGELAKKLKVSRSKVNQIGSALYRDVYANSSAIGMGATKQTSGLATFLPDNAKDLNSLLKKMHNVKGLETVEQRQIKKLLADAFGSGKNPKLFKLYNDKINEYYNIKKKLAGTINLNLDHPLSSQMIKNLKLGKEAMLFVEPLTAEINQGTKSLLDKTYARAFNRGDTAKMKAVINLSKKIELPIGTTKPISEPFYKQDIPKQIIKAAETQNRVIRNIKNLPPEEIQKVFKDKRSKLISPDVKEIDINNLRNLMVELGCGKRGQFSEGTSCEIKGRKKLEKIIKTGVKAGAPEGALASQIIRAGAGIKSAFALRNLFGPAAIAFTVATEAGFVGADMLTSGKTFKEAVGDSLFNYMLGEKTKIDPQKELFKRFSGLGYSDQQLNNFTNLLNQTNQLNTIFKQELKVGDLKEQVKGLREQPKDTFMSPDMSPDDEMSQTDQAIRAEQKLKDESNFLNNLLTNYRSSGMEDTILGDMASGKFQETQQDLKAANILADLEKARSVQDNFFGKFLQGDIGKQKLADKISGLEQDYLNLIQERGPQLTPFAGGGIAGLSGGIDEGPQVESMNPDSQGLQGLMKRARNI